MSNYRSIQKINLLVIHCAAVPNGRETSALDIDLWHQQAGFKRSFDARLGEGKWLKKKYATQQPELRSIGYHTVITLDGNQVPGRSLEETGAHAAGHNSNSIGICLVGTDKFTPEQWESLRSVVRGYQTLIPNLEIIGHRDVNPGKTCPGFSVHEWLDNDMLPLADHVLNPETE